jgi:arginyl-tRNA--protein-N-Asp/Glu arginylyltransferase
MSSAMEQRECGRNLSVCVLDQMFQVFQFASRVLAITVTDVIDSGVSSAMLTCHTPALLTSTSM